MLAALSCSAAAQGAIARLERVEGGGAVQVGSLGDAALLQAAAAGELAIGTLADRGLTPNWVLTVLFNLEAEGVAARDHTLARLTSIVPTTTANLEAMRPSMTALQAALPSAPEAERGSYRETLDAFARSEAVLEDLRRLLGFMESRDYLTWVDVAPGHLLQAGETIRVGADAVAVVRYGTGALVRVGGGTTLEVAPRSVAHADAGEVGARLWRGIADFYFPPGGEYGVGTARAVVRVRGTEFRVRHEDGVTLVAVSSGVVEVTAPDAPAPVRIGAGETRSFGSAASSAAAGLPVGAEAPPAGAAAVDAAPVGAAPVGSAPVGGREVLEAGVRVVVPETWQRAPGLTLWWIGDDPEDPRGIVAFADAPDFDAARDLGDAVVAQAPAVLGGLPATRYDLRWQDTGYVVFMRYLVLDAPLPDGRRPVLTGVWRDTHPYEAEVARFLASARFDAAGDAEVVEVVGASATSPLEGVWRIDANGIVGTLTLTRSGAGWAATLELAWGEEPLRDVTFDGAALRFVRPLGAETQAYVGRLAPDAVTPSIVGTFDQGGAGAYPWRAERIGDATSPPAAVDAVGPTPPADPIQLLAGGWRVDANGYPGTLTFERTGAGWSGVLNRQEAPEELVDIAFDGAEVRFVRPLGAYTQVYGGRLELDGASWRLSGTFDQGGAGAYLWHATRPVDPAGALAGAWRVDMNGYLGTVSFETAADGWTATLVLAGGAPEALTDVTFDGAEIRFVRPQGELTQAFWGLFERDAASVRLHGRFGYGAIEGYRWWAERERGPEE